MISKAPQILLLILIVLTTLACTQERLPCAQPTIMSVILKSHKIIGYDTLNNPVLKDTTLPHPSVAAIDSAGALRGSIYNQGSNYFVVHMSSLADSCMWFFSPDTIAGVPINVDTIHFYYQRQLTFLSNACGYTYYYNLKKLSTTHHTVDSVKIADPTVNSNVNTEHVQIFLH